MNVCWTVLEIITFKKFIISGSYYLTGLDLYHIILICMITKAIANSKIALIKSISTDYIDELFNYCKLIRNVCNNNKIVEGQS